MNLSAADGGAEYSIKAVARATGLTVETLRAWERRYKVIEPRRGASGHRIYTAHDVTRLRRLRETTERGHPISKVAHLSNDELALLLLDREADRPRGNATRVLSDRILRAVADHRAEDCDQAIAVAFALLPAGEVVREVLSPALTEAAERWHRGEFAITQERLLAAAVRGHAYSLLRTYNRLASGATVVFATFSGERHDLGLLLYATVAASRALRVSYLGTDIPAEDIGDHARRVQADAVAINLLTPGEPSHAVDQLEILRGALAPPVEIWLGGSAALGIDPARIPLGVTRLSGFADYEHRLELLGPPYRRMP